jgi:hypothetical protein
MGADEECLDLTTVRPGTLAQTLMDGFQCRPGYQPAIDARLIGTDRDLPAVGV